ncbi:hypothetical protein ACKXF4_09630 [Faecalibacterium prausnitzii]|uniref:hypothetical protein n=1 Tax=Faecalibacterium prausnitzii TaxID=853 RepID=UPI003AB08C5F
MFHNTELVPVCAFEGAKQLEAEIFGAVMQFARTGAPGLGCQYGKDVEQTMLFGPQSRLVTEPSITHQSVSIGTLHRFTDEKIGLAGRTVGALKSAVQYAAIPQHKQNRHPALPFGGIGQDACCYDQLHCIFYIRNSLTNTWAEFIADKNSVQLFRIYAILTERMMTSLDGEKGAKTMRKLATECCDPYFAAGAGDPAPVLVSALTAVVAPMGYGKTPAVNWFLNQRKQTQMHTFSALPHGSRFALCLLPYLCAMDAARGIQGSNRSAFCNIAT